MTLIIQDRVRETTQVVGTGSATLLGAVTGYQSFSTIGNGNTTYYTIADQGGPNWEVGIGTWSTGGTLSRTTVLSSSNGGSLVNFTAGTKDVFVTQPSEKAVFEDASNNVTLPAGLTATSLTDSGLTSGRVTYATTGGLLTDSANMTFDGSTLNTLNLAYTGTLTGGTGIVNLGSGQFYKDGSGNVGIGTSSPLQKLDARGAATFGSSTTLVPAISRSTIPAGSQGLFITASYNQAETNGSYTYADTASYGAGIYLGGNATDSYGGSISYTSYGSGANGNLHIWYRRTGSGTVGESMRIDSSGRLGIGTASPSYKLDVYDTNPVVSQFSSNSGSGAGFYINNTAGSGYKWSVLVGNVSSGYLSFKDETAGAVRLQIDTGGNMKFPTADTGIIFNKTSAVTNSTLNDYETGSFSPTILFGGNNAGQTFNNGPNGRYVKIGKFVYIMIGWYFSSKGSSTGTMTIGNLPFTADNFGFYGSYSPMQLTGLVSVPNNIAMAGTNGGTNYVTLFQGDCGTGLASSNVSNSTYGILGFSYIANF